MTFDRTDGLTKLIIDPETERILGVGTVGAARRGRIAEGVLHGGERHRERFGAVHSSASDAFETSMEAAEVFYGHPTHTYVKKKTPHPASIVASDGEGGFSARSIAR